MRVFGAVRTLVVVLVCAHGAACEEDGTETGQVPVTMDASGVVGGPGADAAQGSDAATGVDASQPTPAVDGAVPGGDGGAPGLDATLPGSDAAASDATAPNSDSATADGSTLPDSGGAMMPGTVPIPAPVADDCITNVSPGDHTFTCGTSSGVEFLVMVDDRCTKFACGLIFDVHGAAMTGEDMRDNGQLHRLAPSKGYLTVHPTATAGAWDFPTDGPKLKDFMTRMIKAFHIDTKRVHMTGFSMGAGMTFWFLCNHTAAMASTAPVTGSSASQVKVEATGAPCIESIDANWKPRVPILFMSGIEDGALAIDVARERTMGIVTRLGLTGGQQVDGDDTFTRKRWTGADGMVFDFLEHEYTNFLLAGHCIPGDAGGLFGCDSGGSTLKWGPVVLQWFVDHPQP